MESCNGDTYAFAKPIGPGKSLHADWSAEESELRAATSRTQDSRRQLAIATPDRGIEPFHYRTQDRTETSHLRTRPRALPAEPTRSHSSSNTAIMSGAGPSPRFFQQPLRYMKWASINKPAYFYSIMVGCAGPALVVTVPPIRRYMGEEPIPKIPMTYPGTWRE